MTGLRGRPHFGLSIPFASSAAISSREYTSPHAVSSAGTSPRRTYFRRLFGVVPSIFAAWRVLTIFFESMGKEWHGIIFAATHISLAIL